MNSSANFSFGGQFDILSLDSIVYQWIPQTIFPSAVNLIFCHWIPLFISEFLSQFFLRRSIWYSVSWFHCLSVNSSANFSFGGQFDILSLDSIVYQWIPQPIFPSAVNLIFCHGFHCLSVKSSANFSFGGQFDILSLDSIVYQWIPQPIFPSAVNLIFCHWIPLFISEFLSQFFLRRSIWYSVTGFHCLSVNSSANFSFGGQYDILSLDSIVYQWILQPVFPSAVNLIFCHWIPLFISEFLSQFFLRRSIWYSVTRFHCLSVNSSANFSFGGQFDILSLDSIVYQWIPQPIFPSAVNLIFCHWIPSFISEFLSQIFLRRSIWYSVTGFHCLSVNSSTNFSFGGQFDILSLDSIVYQWIPQPIFPSAVNLIFCHWIPLFISEFLSQFFLRRSIWYSVTGFHCLSVNYSAKFSFGGKFDILSLDSIVYHWIPQPIFPSAVNLIFCHWIPLFISEFLSQFLLRRSIWYSVTGFHCLSGNSSANFSFGGQFDILSLDSIVYQWTPQPIFPSAVNLIFCHWIPLFISEFLSQFFLRRSIWYSVTGFHCLSVNSSASFSFGGQFDILFLDSIVYQWIPQQIFPSAVNLIFCHWIPLFISEFLSKFFLRLSIWYSVTGFHCLSVNSSASFSFGGQFDILSLVSIVYQWIPQPVFPSVVNLIFCHWIPLFISEFLSQFFLRRSIWYSGTGFHCLSVNASANFSFGGQFDILSLDSIVYQWIPQPIFLSVTGFNTHFSYFFDMYPSRPIFITKFKYYKIHVSRSFLNNFFFRIKKTN